MDAEDLHGYLEALVEERVPTLFERTTPPSAAEERAFLQSLQESEGSFALVAENHEGDIVGMLDVQRHKRQEMAHGAVFGMSVARRWRGCGIGHRLLAEMLEVLKREAIISRIELEVFSNNPAIRLYQRFGFREEGRRRGAVIVGGEAVDIVLMARCVDETRKP